MSKIPDQILDVRVRVPACQDIGYITNANGGALIIEAINPAIDRPPTSPKPTFEGSQTLVDLSDLRQLHSRHNRQSERFVALEKLVESIRLVADGAHIRCDVLTKRVSALESHTGRNAMAERIGTLEAHAEGVLGIIDVYGAEAAQQTERIDNIEKHSEAMQDHIEALLRIRELVTRLIDYMGLEVGDFGKVKPKRQESASEVVQRMRGERTFKGDGDKIVEVKPRVIKGGWLNMYPDGGLPSWHPSRSHADMNAGGARIACIQIPDITEGDGL